MILGIGSDLCDIRRIEKSIERFGERFTHRIYTEGERARSDLRRLQAMTPEGHKAVVHVSLTDDPPMAQAFVIIEALPA